MFLTTHNLSDVRNLMKTTHISNTSVYENTHKRSAADTRFDVKWGSKNKIICFFILALVKKRN